MTVFIDVVNFNSDASCIDSRRWFEAMSGGYNSEFARWLKLYVSHRKPVCLGLTGGTIADLSVFNIESINIIKENQDIFQIIARPFAHDLSFFRTDWGFNMNLMLGIKIAKTLFGRVSKYYLPPEFMQTNRQTKLLSDNGVLATFILRSRFGDKGSSIPNNIFTLNGIPDGRLACIPCTEDLTTSYLKAIQLLDNRQWDSSMEQLGDAVLWRDGESFLLIPDGIEREKYWLSTCNHDRTHIKPDLFYMNSIESLHGYPVHPFSAWSNELSMLWFIERVSNMERNISGTTDAKKISAWLNCIGTDILAAVEKKAPAVMLKALGTNSLSTFNIYRSNRGFEGEAHLISAETGEGITGTECWQVRANNRERIITELIH